MARRKRLLRTRRLLRGSPPRAGGQGPGDEVTGAVRPSGGSGGSPPRADTAKATVTKSRGPLGQRGVSGGSPPRAGGQGPGDEVTGAFRPAGGSGGSPPRADTDRGSLSVELVVLAPALALLL